MYRAEKQSGADRQRLHQLYGEPSDKIRIYSASSQQTCSFAEPAHLGYVK